MFRNRTVKVSDELWRAAKAKAREEDTTVSQVIRRFLKSYAQHGKNAFRNMERWQSAHD